ncbi:hypothetical protein [Pseudomonas mosselii]|uniref:hypothetical protein n=1 Tax=Pseudomonas mosselii TaxID=78327 RepID=UPI002022ED1E|nr:hypothetical protein [Pseudomonas mosselii]MCL8302196.1 hypothetical protein [Pseudomonas mosselii]
MFRVSFQAPGRERRMEIVADTDPPVANEEVALLWILQAFEGKGVPIDVDWLADLATLRKQIAQIGVTDVTWETM